MQARGRRAVASSLASILFFLLLAAAPLGTLLPAHASADIPVVIPGTDASRDVRWWLNTSQGLTVQDVALASGKASLAWKYANLSWPDASAFEANGTLDANLSVSGGGIQLAADQSNHVANGDFADNSSWRFEPGPQGRTTAAWDPAAKTAVVSSASPSTQSLWDAMDSTAPWSFVESSNVFAGFGLNTTNPKQGTGMIEIDVGGVSGPDPHYVGVARTSSVNWSGVDRLVLWLAMNASAAVTFNLTAVNSNHSPVHTSPQSLAVGWQEVTVDLGELGPDRSALSSVTLRFDGQFPASVHFFIDDGRVGLAKLYADTAVISQSIAKSTTTTPAFGSAVLNLNWTATNMTNVTHLAIAANVSGPSGALEQVLPISAIGPWQGFVADVSSIMASPGTYSVGLEVRVAANTTGSINATVRIDDVSLIIPNPHNGTYISDAISLGPPSECLRLSWTAAIPSATSIVFGLRAGNSTSPNSSGWSPWQAWSSNGSYAPSVSGSHVQVRARLRTTNASVTPVLVSMELGTRHRASEGSVVSDPYAAPADFLRWRTLANASQVPPSTSIQYFVGDGSYWTPVVPGENLSALSSRTIQWRAVLKTSNGLSTPSLSRLDLVYEYLGPIVRVAIFFSGSLIVHSGDAIAFHATAYDAGSHVNGSAMFEWSTDDPTGSISNGTYRAGSEGPHNVTVKVLGLPGVSNRVPVLVLAAVPPGIPLWAAIQPLAIVLAIVAVVAYVGYTIVSRRLFVIDDVFLISRDSRLMMHNTRRMRADRDEDILSGMLTAILTFVRDFDREENGELRRFEFGGKTALLERGEHAYLAAVYTGRVPRWAGKDLRRFMRDLEVRFGDRFARWSGSPEDLQGLKEFTERFVSRVRYRARRDRIRAGS